MNAVWPHLPALQVVIPLVGALVVGFLRRGETAFAITALVSWLMPLIAGAMLWQVLSGDPISYHLGGWEPPWGIEYRVDALNAFVLLLVSVVGAVIIPFARRSVAFEIEEWRQAWFYSMYLLCLTGLLGITITGDAFNAFVFLEISSLSTYVLIAMGRDRRALLAAFQYLIVGTIGATFYVIGIGLIYLLTGTLNMVDMGARLAQAWPGQTQTVVAALAFVTVGISLKLALFPLHVWLPNAYAFAPSWVTAFLSATATKVAIYLLVRFFFSIFGVSIGIEILPITEIIIALSLAAMFVASIIAVFEPNLKRMLAYSSVAQIGYITLGIGLANQAGLTGGLVHIANHALMKAALFLAAGAIFYRACPMKVTDIAGIGRKMPLTMMAFTIASFGLIGTPGTAGFISKWHLAVGAVDKGWWGLVFLIMGSSLLTLIYVGRVLEVAWLREASPEIAHASDPPLSMLLPLLVLAAATIYFGFNTEWTVGVAGTAAKALLGGLAMTAVVSPEWLVLFAVLIPLVGALLIPLFHRAPNLRETVTLAAAGALCITVLGLLGPVLAGARPEASIVDVAPGLALAFKVEPLGMLFALVASSLWIVNSIYSIGYMRANEEPRQTTFYVYFAVALGSTIGVAFAKNLFTLFLFYEALTLSTYPLVTHKASDEAVRAGRLYLLLLLGTSLVLFLPAIIATYALAGTLDFTPGGILGGKAGPGVTAVLLALYVFGIGKAAVMPLHFWLPAAMVAPTPVSALLHAVAVVKAGVFAILKVIVFIFGVDALSTTGQSTWLTLVAGATIIVASLVALRQDNLKRRLAYSTVSQLSYVILGAAILAPISMIGAAVHVAAHAVSKITLFFAAGSIYTVSHLTEVSQFDGIGRRMPWTMGAFAIGAISMIGIPPTAGFLGKWFMLTGAMQTANWIAVGVIAASTLLNAGYFLPIVFRAFFREAPAGHAHEHGEASWPIVLALTATAVGTVVLFFAPDIPVALANLMIGR